MRKFLIVVALAMGTVAVTGDRSAEAADKLKAQKGKARSEIGMNHVRNTRGVKRGSKLKRKGSAKQDTPISTFNLQDSFPKSFD